MAIRSGFFNSVNGDRKYKADFFAEYFASFIANGVFPNPSTGLQVLANQNMTVAIKPGKAWINGYFFVNDSDYILTIDNADGVLNRIDRIVLQLNYLNREIVPVIKKGTFASSPVAPSLQRDADAYEIALADVYVGKGVLSISQANITDLRLNTELCGIVKGTIDQIDTTDLFAQYDDAFQSWFETVRDILNENVAANLANKIADLDDRKAEKVTLNEHMNDYVKHPAYVTASGKNDYAVTLNPAPTSYVDGMAIVVKIGTSSDNNTTLNVNGLGAKQILKTDGSRVSDLKANGVYTLRYNGSAFILQGERGGGVDGLVPVEIIASSRAIDTYRLSFGATNNYIVGYYKENTTIYDKKTKEKVKSVPGVVSALYCSGTRVVTLKEDTSKVTVKVFDEELNLVSNFTVSGSIMAFILEEPYIYVLSGTHGKSDWSMKLYDISGALIRSGPERYGDIYSSTRFVQSAKDTNYLYTINPNSSIKQVVKTSKSNFTDTIASPDLNYLVNRIVVFGEYVFALSVNDGTYKLRKSDLSLVSYHNFVKVLEATKEELYAMQEVNLEGDTISVLKAVNENLEPLRSSAISRVDYRSMTKDNDESLIKPTFYMWENTDTTVKYIQKIVDYGGTMR